MVEQFVSPEGARFLQAVARKPGQPSGEIYRAAGIYIGIGIHVRKELEDQGLIEVRKVRTEKQKAARRGNFGNILYPTAKGLELLKKIGLEVEQEPSKAEVCAIEQAEKPSQEVPVGQMIGGKLGCKHWWQIEPADGPISKGECDLCHGISSFKNSFESSPFIDVTEHPGVSPGIH